MGFFYLYKDGMKKKINISTVDSLSFIGPKDQNIKLIEKSFKSKIVVRGNEVIIDGLKKEIDIINLLIDDIIVTINKKGFVDKEDVKLLINLAKSGETSENITNNEFPIILHTHKGTICAKTRGQKTNHMTYRRIIEARIISHSLGLRHQSLSF